ncbi:MAG: hypothetical protein IT179_07865 [Acidobacteria bacterium]|nr:hypothetical protein [Acidobacteriota bacterium]
MPTYTITLRITTDTRTDPHLRSAQSIQNELRAWLDSLNAGVVALTVKKEQP